MQNHRRTSRMIETRRLKTLAQICGWLKPPPSSDPGKQKQKDSFEGSIISRFIQQQWCNITESQQPTLDVPGFVVPACYSESALSVKTPRLSHSSVEKVSGTDDLLNRRVWRRRWDIHQRWWSHPGGFSPWLSNIRSVQKRTPNTCPPAWAPVSDQQPPQPFVFPRK